MPDVLETQIFAGGEYKRFGEVTLADAQARADELRGIGGVNGMARLMSIAHAWAEFAKLMTDDEIAKVSDLEPEVAAEWAEKLWVVPPGGSLLG